MLHVIMKGLHNDIGHPGRERTTKLVRERLYWPGMTAEVDQWITRCERCLKRKSTTHYCTYFLCTGTCVF